MTAIPFILVPAETSLRHRNAFATGQPLMESAPDRNLLRSPTEPGQTHPAAAGEEPCDTLESGRQAARRPGPTPRTPAVMGATGAVRAPSTCGARSGLAAPGPESRVSSGDGAPATAAAGTVAQGGFTGSAQPLAMQATTSLKPIIDATRSMDSQLATDLQTACRELVMKIGAAAAVAASGGSPRQHVEAACAAIGALMGGLALANTLGYVLPAATEEPMELLRRALATLRCG